MRRTAVDPLSAAGTPAQPGQVGFRPRFVEEDQAGRIEADLLPAPRPAGLRNVGAGLLAGVECLFLYVRSNFCRT